MIFRGIIARELAIEAMIIGPAAIAFKFFNSQYDIRYMHRSGRGSNRESSRYRACPDAM